MCGICGYVGAKREAQADAAVRRMMAALRHRGPDDEGMLSVSGATLGMRRLSVIDLAGGSQPTLNEDRSVAVTFNGEIYNFRELRYALEAQGHVFHTRSDTETIVHAYEAWGKDCVRHLRGMFAFAVLDGREKPGHFAPRVFLARDRWGIKPLYYAAADGALVFASEVRALLASGLVSPRLCDSALEAYLLFGSVPEPATLVEGVYSLPPGHRLLISDAARPTAAQPEPYWSFGEVTQASSRETPRNVCEAAKELRPLLEDAVRSHLVADVPLGLFLSSGIDSTALAALASREQRDLHTFTVVFPEQDFSEAALARKTAQRFGTQHEEFLLTAEQMLGRLDEAVAALDQPTMDGINTYFVSWAARQVGLKVALSGLGGDEVFGGYGTFRTTPRAASLAKAGRLVPRPMRSATAAAVQLFAHFRRTDAGRKASALWRDPAALPHAYFFARALFTPEQAAGLLCADTDCNAPWRAWMRETAYQADRLDRFASVLCLEMRSYMVQTLLRDTDAVSMSHSLEVRVPLLDHRIVEFVLRLPDSARRRRGVPKALLVEALGDLLAPEIVRQRKRTFTLPWERWLRGALRERVAEGLEDLAPALLPALRPDALRSVWRDFLAGRTSWSRAWSLYVLNEWARRNLVADVAHGEAAAPASLPAGSVTR